MSEPMPDPIATAEEFDREQRDKAAAREYQFRVKQASDRVTVVLAAIWAPVALAALAFIAFLVWQVTSQHTERDRTREELKARNVTVWCYADPHSDRGTSTITGTPDQVRGFCPDAYTGNYLQP